jgi:putative membrane protein
MTFKIDHDRINAAIAAAEAETSGEITCIIQSKALEYRETPLIWSFGVALLGPVILASFNIWPQDWLVRFVPPVLADWQAVHNLSDFYRRLETIGIYGVTQLLLFGLSYLIISLPVVKLALTPTATKRRRAHKKAMEQFLARGLHLTHARTGVMIYCALKERFVEVIADEGIYQKVDKVVWDETIKGLVHHTKSGDMTTGFVEAIEACGKVLKTHFPPDSVNKNELPDVLIEI